MPLLAATLALLFAQPPAWIQRAGVPGPIVTWRAADVLGTPVVEGIVVNRDTTSHTVTVNVVDSRFDPPRIVKLRELAGSRVRWLRAGVRDGLAGPDRGRRHRRTRGDSLPSPCRAQPLAPDRPHRPRVAARAEGGPLGSAACPIASTSPGTTRPTAAGGRADGAADRLRARPAGARPDRVHRPARS